MIIHGREQTITAIAWLMILYGVCCWLGLGYCWFVLDTVKEMNDREELSRRAHITLHTSTRKNTGILYNVCGRKLENPYDIFWAIFSVFFLSLIIITRADTGTHALKSILPLVSFLLLHSLCQTRREREKKIVLWMKQKNFFPIDRSTTTTTHFISSLEIKKRVSQPVRVWVCVWVCEFWEELVFKVYIPI